MGKRAFIRLTAVFFVLGIVAFSIAGIKKHFTIDPAKCDACGTCMEECPEGAISEGKVDGKDVMIIDPQKCNACGVCAEVCPQESIYPDSSDLSVKIKGEKKKEGEEAKTTKVVKKEEPAENEEPAEKKKKKVTKYTVK